MADVGTSVSSGIEGRWSAQGFSAAASQILHATPGLADIVVWIAGIQDVAPMARRSHGLLSPAERSEATRRPGGPVRDAFVARRVLRRALVAAHLGCDPAEVEIGTRCRRCGDARHGPPAVIAPDPGLHLSTSSVGDLLAVALAPFPVGLDVERLDRFDARTALDADRATSGAWSAVARSMTPALSPAHVWTALECLCKGLGTGLVTSTRQVEEALAHWSFMWCAPDAGSLGCVGATRPITALSTVAAPTGRPERRA